MQTLKINKWLILALLMLYSVGFYSYNVYVEEQKKELVGSLSALNKATSSNIQNNIHFQNDEINKSLKTFTSIYQDLIVNLSKDPANDILYQKVEEKLKLFFSGFFAFTLATKQGDVIIKDFEMLIGKTCLIDIKSFAKSHYRELSLHRNPIAHHVDYMMDWTSPTDGGVIFISFYPNQISKYLNLVNNTNQNLYLLNKYNKKLIDFDSKKTRDSTRDLIYISQDSINDTAIYQDLENTSWTLLVVTKNTLLVSELKLLELKIRNLWLTFIMILSICIVLVNKLFIIKLDMEKKLRKYYQDNYFQSASVSLVICGETAQIIDVNQAATKFYGFSKKQLLSRTFFDLSVKGENQNKNIIEMMQKSSLNHIHCTHKLLNSKTVELEVYFSEFLENDKSLYLLQVQEVTTKALFQNLLKNKTEVLEAITYALPDMTFIITSSGQFIDVLDSEMLTNLHKHDVVGANISDFFDNKLILSAKKIMKKAFKTKKIQYLEYQSDITGKKIWYEGRVVPMEFHVNKEKSVLWLARNIEDKKFAEVELNMAAMVMDISEPIIICDAASNIIKANHSFVDVFGYSENELIGKNIGIIRSTNIQQKILYNAIFSHILVNGIWNGITENICKDGTSISLLETVSLIKNSDGNLNKIIRQFKDVSEINNLKIQIDKKEARFRAIVENGNEIVIIFDREKLTYVSPSVIEMTGYRTDEVMKTGLIKFTYGHDVRGLLRIYLKCIKNAGEVVNIPAFRIIIASGKYKWVQGTLGNYMGVTGVEGFVLILDNVTSMIESKKILKKEERKFKAIIENGLDSIVVFNQNRFITYTSPSVGKTLGYAKNELIGMKTVEIVHPSDYKNSRGSFDLLIKNPGTSLPVPELRVQHKNGHFLTFEGTITSIYDEESEDIVVFNARDITEKKRTAEKIKHLALYDPLTDLPNRTFLMAYLDKAIAATKRQKIYGVVAFMDLDHFKNVNDSLGHDVGDGLLKEVASRLKKILRKEDLISRIGGDEFVMVLPSVGLNENEAFDRVDSFCNKVLSVMSKKFIINGHDIHISPSIGLKLFFEKTIESISVILKHADGAMYRAKEHGRNQFIYYEEAIQEKADLRVKYEHDLYDAISEKQFVLHYQPQYSSDGLIVGAEALVRWYHPNKGMISPIDFIPIAEKSGVIIKLGNWVYQKAISDLYNCLQNGLIDNDFNLSINVSPKQFDTVNFVNDFISIIKRYPSLKNMIKLEITEGLLFDNIETAVEKMNILIKHGVSFSLDDFGTGYSSFKHLTQMPISQLKIDQYFVRNLDNTRDEAVVKMIISMASYLKLDVVAEGVESLTQLEFFNLHKQVIIQGNYYSKAVDIVDLSNQLKKKYRVKYRNKVVSIT